MAPFVTDAQALFPAGSPSGAPSILEDLSNSKPTEHFFEFVQRKSQEYRGRNGRDEEEPFLPYDELRRYWTIRRILAVGDSYPSEIFIRPVLIRDHYLRVFSILVYVARLPFISSFMHHQLADTRFPGHFPPGVFDAPSHQDIVERFLLHQWMFYPAILDSDELNDTILPPERILPLYSKEVLRNGPAGMVEAATVAKVQFHPSCDNVCKKRDCPETPPTYILKTYHGEQYERHYDHETRAFTRLQSIPSTGHVVECHATFRHGDTLNLVMAYVPGGDLLQYFNTQIRPQDAEETIHFWDSLTRLILGLHHIHQVEVKGDRPAKYQLVHQDLKPDNILIDPRRGPNTHQFSPVIGDLGHCHTSYINGEAKDGFAVDYRGNQTYSAPESIHHAGFRRSGPNHITPDADIFSAGALFSDAAAWISGGQSGRDEYLHLRERETAKIPGFADSGYDGAFHNGTERLDCVDQTHRCIRSTLPRYDNITSRILDIVDSYMMTPTHRMPATQLYTKFEIEIGKAQQELHSGLPPPEPASYGRLRAESLLPTISLDGLLTPPPTGKLDGIWSPPDTARSMSTDGYPDDQDLSSPETSPFPQTVIETAQHLARITGLDVSTPTLSSPVRPHGPLRHPLTNPVILPSDKNHQPVQDTRLRSKSEMKARLTMSDATEWRINKKAKRDVNPNVDRVIQELITNLHGRDHLFLIDDTKSMQQHSPEVESTFQTLAYIAKHIDPNNLEMSFVSKPSKIHEGKHTKPLVEILQQHGRKYSALEGSIESSLSQLVNKRIMRGLPKRLPGYGEFAMGTKPITVFVFTDGRWGNKVRTGNGLDRPIKSLMHEIKERRLTRTQVMFQFLRFGNDEEGRAHLQHLDEFGKKEDCDIVDYRDINGDVWAMFLAAYTEHNDKENDSHDDSQ